MCLQGTQAYHTLSDEEKEIFSTRVTTLFEKMNAGVSYQDITKTAGDTLKVLPILVQGAKAEKDLDLYLAATFTAQFARVTVELKAIDASIDSDDDITPDHATLLEGPIDRLYTYLHEDKQWQHLMPYLSFSTQKLGIVRDQIRKSKKGEASAYLADKIDAIEKLLKPAASDIADLTQPVSPPEVTAQQPELQKRLVQVEIEIKKKDEEIAAARKVADEQTKAKEKLEAEQTALESTLADKGRICNKMEQQHKDELAAKDQACEAQIKAVQEDLRKESKANEDFRRQVKEEKEKAESDKRAAEAVAASAAQDKDAKRLARRNELVAAMNDPQALLDFLSTHQQNGTLRSIQREQVPSKEECISRLTKLWGSEGDLIRQLKPHQLMNDLDSAFEFEVKTTTVARACLKTLEIYWDCGTDEFLSTGWSTAAITMLNYGLMPYQEATELSTLAMAVADVTEMLQRATQASVQPTPTTPPNTLQNSFGSSNSTEQPAVFDKSLNSSFNSNGTAATAVSSMQQSPFAAAANQTQGIPASFGQVIAADPLEAELSDDYIKSQSLMVPYDQAAAMDTSEKSGNTACPNMVQHGHCMDDLCLYSHAPETNGQAKLPAQPQDDRLAMMPCRYITSHGICTKAGCVFAHPPGTHQPKTPSGPAGSMFGAQPNNNNARQCRNENNGGRCTRGGCHFSHQHPHGSSVGNNAAPSGMSGAQPNARQCRNETNGGRCTREGCHFSHQYPHGSSLAPTDMSIRGQANAPSNPFQSGSTSNSGFRQPTFQPRTQPSLESRIIFPRNAYVPSPLSSVATGPH